MGEERKQKSLGVNAFLNAFRTGLSIIFPLITYPYAFRILQAEGIGKVDYATSIVSYFSMIAALGITTYAIREGAKCRDDKEKFKKLGNQIFSINVYSTIIAYIALFAFMLIFQSLRSYDGLITLLSLSMAFTTLGIEWINIIYEDYLFITIRSIVTHVVSLVLLFVFVKDTEDYYIYAALSVLTNGIICISNWIYCRKYTHLHVVKKINLRQHIGPILTLFVNSIATKIYVNADTTMLGAMEGDYYVGIYSLAVKVYSAVKTMIAAIYSVAISRISYYIEQRENDKVRRTYTNVLSNLTLILVPASVGLISISREVVLFMGSSDYISAVPTLQILSISLIGAVFGGAVSYCLNIPLGKERINVVATSLSAVINIGLNFFMIPLFKQNGAALTTVISEFFVFFYCMIANKDFKKFVDFRIWGKSALQAGIGAVLIVIISFLVRAFTSNTWIILIAVIILSVIAYGIELLLFKNELVLGILRRIKIIKK